MTSHAMTRAELKPLSVAVPLREDPPGVFRVRTSRVLLELVIRAFQRGETPEGIVQSYDTRSLPLGATCCSLCGGCIQEAAQPDGRPIEIDSGRLRAN